MLCHFPLPHLGSMKAIAQNSPMRLRWSRGFKSNGVHVPAQFFLEVSQGPLHVGDTSLQLAFILVTLLSWMQSQE